MPPPAAPLALRVPARAGEPPAGAGGPVPRQWR